MRIISSKALIGAVTAAALLGGAFISSANAAGTGLTNPVGTPSAPASTSLSGGFTNTTTVGNSGNAFGGPTEGDFSASDAGATASSDESCLVQKPVISHGRVIGHHTVNAC